MIFNKYFSKSNVIKTLKKNKKIDLKYFQKPIRNSINTIGNSFLKNNITNLENKINYNFFKIKKSDLNFLTNLNKKKIF